MLEQPSRKDKATLKLKPYVLALAVLWTALVGGIFLVYSVLGYGVLWALGLLGLWLGANHLEKRLMQLHRAEEALQVSRDLANVLLNAPGDGAYLLDREGVILTANEAGAQRINLTLQELIGRNAFDLFPPGLAEARRGKVAEVFHSGRSLRFEDERAGRLISNSLYPVFDPKGQVKEVAVFVQDITETRAREAALATALQQARTSEALVSRSKLMVIRWPAEPDSDVEFVSDNVSQLGYTPEDFFTGGISWIGITHGEDVLRVLEELAAHMADGAQEFSTEYRLVDRDGNTRWVMDQTRLFRNDHGRVMCRESVVLEITDRKQMEEALRESEERYRSLFQNSHAVMLLIDPDTGGIVDANPAAGAYYGYDSTMIRTMKIYDINTLTHDQLMEEMAQARAGRRNYFLFQHRLADGSIHPVEVFSGPIELRGKKLLYSIVHDVTERKQAEEALRESRTMLRTIIDAVPLWISCSDRRGVYLIANQRYSETFGKPLADIEGSHYSQVLPFYVREKHKRLIDACLSGEIVTYDAIHPRPNGHAFHTHGIYTPLFNPEGEVGGYTVVVTDVTAMKEAEAELRRLYEQTQRDADTKTELLKEVNHRVGNNLIAIMGLLLAEQRHAPKEGRPFVKMALNNVSNRIQGMLEVHQLLSESEWAPMRLSELAARVITVVFSTLPAGRRAVVEVLPSSVEVSPRQAANLALVINELATNTLKYALRKREKAHITVRIGLENDGIVLEYQDDGPGYPDDVLRLERQGVGLYLLQQLIAGTLRGTFQLANAEGAVARLAIKTEETTRT